MKVTATQTGYFGNRLREPGAQFEIPDQPTRKLTPADDAVTRAMAVKGQVPVAFAAVWMRPGSAPLQEQTAPVQSHLKEDKDEAIDLNRDVT